uniref:LD43225p n=1 Tax=Drosophila melanogaster TaxID=7227 RepID=Q8T004_DROME|nr:LD43225p [Drosophila melanogaster]
MFFIHAPEEEKCMEAQLDILMKINSGEYRLVKKNKRSSVWNVYREIARPDGTKLKCRYFCMGCKRVMQSTGGTTSNLRIHKCHVRYIKQNGHLTDGSHSYDHDPAPPASQPSPRVQKPKTRRPTSYSTQCEQFYEVTMDPETQYSDLDDEIEASLEEEQTLKSKRELESSHSRPLLKLFSEENLSTEPEEPEDEIEIVEAEDQVPIELDLCDIQHTTSDAGGEAIEPKPTESVAQFDANAISEAESYAKAWAHAFLRLNEDQKFYAKRSIDELLVLGRLERLSISTVTSLTTNL